MLDGAPKHDRLPLAFQLLPICALHKPAKRLPDQPLIANSN
jgi:hypothetical protein